MKTIVCFGDSNTWGYIPGSDVKRYAHDTRWPGVMQRALSNKARVIEEGLNGRTTVWNDPMKPMRNGREHLPVVLETHAPIDLLIIALGTNDLKHHFGLSAFDVAQGARVLVEFAMQSDAGPVVGDRKAPPHALLVCPARPVAATNPPGHRFDTAVERAADLSHAYREVANETGCLFVDANEFVTASPIDGIHLDADAHRDLGEAMARFIAPKL